MSRRSILHTSQRNVPQEYRSFAEAEANLDHFIEEVYNTKRLHSQLGYCPPCEFEAAFAANQASKTGL